MRLGTPRKWPSQPGSRDGQVDRMEKMPRRGKKPSQAQFYMHIAGRLACAGLAYALAPIARHRQPANPGLTGGLPVGQGQKRRRYRSGRYGAAIGLVWLLWCVGVSERRATRRTDEKGPGGPKEWKF
jgi:hypothetical protein